MRLVKEYICDNYYKPSDDEIKECMQIVKNENCVIKLVWFFNGWHHILITSDMTLEDCKKKLPRRYPV